MVMFPPMKRARVETTDEQGKDILNNDDKKPAAAATEEDQQQQQQQQQQPRILPVVVTSSQQIQQYYHSSTASSMLADVFSLVPSGEKKKDSIKKLLIMDLQAPKAGVVFAAVTKLAHAVTTVHNNVTNNTTTENACKEIVRLGGPSLLVVAMEKWHKEERILTKLFWIMSAVIKQLHEDPLIPLPSLFIEMEALELVTASMKKFSESEVLNRRGLNALAKIFIKSEPATQDAATKFVTMQGGIDLVVSAMRKFHNSENVQHAGCRVLFNLTCLGEDFKRAMLDAGVLTAVAAAKTRFRDNKCIDEGGFLICKYLFDYNTQNASAAAGGGGGESEETAP